LPSSGELEEFSPDDEDDEAEADPEDEDKLRPFEL